MTVRRLVVNAAPTKQQLVDYANAAAQVNLYAYAITQQSLPVLNSPPPNYANFTVQFEPAKAHCLTWTGGIFPTLLSFPGTIAIQANDLFSLEESIASSYLQLLQSDPTDTAAKAKLNQALTSIQNLVNDQLKTANDLLNNMTQFSTSIARDAQALSSIATQALNDAVTDEVSISQLNAAIADLQNQVNSMQTWLTVSDDVANTSIFVGLIGATLCLVPGAQGVGVALLVLAVAGLAASIPASIILENKIKSAQSQIQTDQQQVTSLNKDVILLQGVNSQFQGLVNANQAAQKAMQAVIQMWQTLDSTLEEVKTDLTDVENDVTAADYAQALADLNAAADEWAQVVAFANALAGVNYSWQDQAGNWHSYTTQAPTANSATITSISSPSSLQPAA